MRTSSGSNESVNEPAFAVTAWLPSRLRRVRLPTAGTVIVALAEARLARAFLGFRRGLAEPLEQSDLLLRVLLHRVDVGQVEHELFDPRAELRCEVRRRRAGERVDVFPRWLPHRPKPNGD